MFFKYAVFLNLKIPLIASSILQTGHIVQIVGPNKE